jgi:hypothetical protein
MARRYTFPARIFTKIRINSMRDGDGKKPLIAIVDDEPDLQKLYRLAISSRGYPIAYIASDGTDALEKQNKANHKPDIVIMDHRMPTKNGVETTREIFGHRRCNRDSSAGDGDVHRIEKQHIYKNFYQLQLMSIIEISNDTPAEMLTRLAWSIHRATGGLPVALKSRNRPGVFVDRDGSVHTDYESEALDRVFSDIDRKKVRVDRGKYAGMPMMISPIEDKEGDPIAAIGVVDDLGTLSLQEFVEISETIRNQILSGI